MAVWDLCVVAQQQRLFLDLRGWLLHSACCLLVDFLAYSSTPKTEAVHSSENSVKFCQITLRHISEFSKYPCYSPEVHNFLCRFKVCLIAQQIIFPLLLVYFSSLFISFLPFRFPFLPPSPLLLITFLTTTWHDLRFADGGDLNKQARRAGNWLSSSLIYI